MRSGPVLLWLLLFTLACEGRIRPIAGPADALPDAGLMDSIPPGADAAPQDALADATADASPLDLGADAGGGDVAPPDGAPEDAAPPDAAPPDAAPPDAAPPDAASPDADAGPAADAAAQGSLRFFGTGSGDIDRVKIRVDDPASTLPGPPADVGATDFTIELWVRGRALDNGSAPVVCGANLAWINGNILLDRDRYNQDRKFGLSVAGGRLVFGVSGDGTGDLSLCGARAVLDDQWHHVAVQRRRSDGQLWLFVDGALEAQADGPDGDVSYPDDGVPGSFCGGPCTNSDPFLVIAAEKHDAGPAYPSFSGWVDELRLSTVLRYSAAFTPPRAPFVTDADTAALYEFDEGRGRVLRDTSGHPGGPSNGDLRVGGSPAGPAWSSETPF